MKKYIYLTLVIILAGFAYADLTQNLIGYWSFDSDGNDSTANNNDFEGIGVHYQSDGLVNTSVRLDGDGDVLNGTNSSLFNLKQNFTINFWLFLNRTDTLERIITKSGTTGNDDWYVGVSGANKLGFTKYNGSGNLKTLFYGTNKFPTLTWNMVTITFDNATLSLYSNAQQNESRTVHGYQHNGHPIRIGRLSEGDSDFFNGSIDELGIWNRTLSASEISSLYNSGSGLAYSGLDMGSPTLSLTENDTLVIYEEEAISITWSATDNTGVYMTIFNVTNPSGVLVHNRSENNGTIVLIPANLTVRGDYTINLWANDTRNNNNFTKLEFTVADTPELKLADISPVSKNLMNNGLMIFVAIAGIAAFMYPLTKIGGLNWNIGQWIRYFVIGLITIFLIVILLGEIGAI